MKKKRRNVIVAAVFVIVLLVCVWRLYPHNLSLIIPGGKNGITSLACTLNECGIESGNPYIDSYDLNELSPHDDDFKEIIAILDSSHYRQDFRNLLPGGVISVGSDDSVKLITIVIVCGNEEDEYCLISMTDESMIAVSSDADTGFKIYHPTNREIINLLSDYLQMHGNKE